jgi:hypothetical protein
VESAERRWQQKCIDGVLTAEVLAAFRAPMEASPLQMPAIALTLHAAVTRSLAVPETVP